MGQPDPRVDAYIDKAAEFARPILQHLREVVHTACPAAEETLKWGAPSFMYGGKILCSMAAFKQHASFGFWQGARVVGADGANADEGMGQFGRISRLSDLPGKRVLGGYVRQAMKLIDEGVTRPSTKDAKPKPPLVVPDDLTTALAKNRKARATFDAFTPSHRRDYVEWITEAKRAETRQRRLTQALEWMAEGKPRNWKYTNC
ncbi:MAG: YdeI/OmpD-associated family protein [Lysobacter sp.]